MVTKITRTMNLSAKISNGEIVKTYGIFPASTVNEIYPDADAVDIVATVSMPLKNFVEGGTISKWELCSPTAEKTNTEPTKEE